MNYHVVLFIKPEPVDYAGALKYKISKSKFDRIIDPAVTMIQFDDAVYRLDDKKVFSIENWKNETTDSLLVCEAHKMKQQ